MDILSWAAIATIAAATVYAYLRKALLSLTYAIAVLVVYAFQAIEPLVAFDLGLLSGPGLTPEPWTWVTFQFVHGSIAHLLLNLMGFVFLSPVFEERVGSLAWGVLFVAGGAVGAAFSIALAGDRTFLLVGASAGLLAILGGYARLYRRERVSLFIPLRGVPTLPILYVVIGFFVIQTVLSLVQPTGLRGIAWEAHVGGLALGFAAAPLATRLAPARGRQVRPAHLEDFRDLAVTPELRRVLEEAERADLPEVRQAWLERFVRTARCPRCAGPLRWAWGSLRSDCGWRRHLRLG